MISLQCRLLSKANFLGVKCFKVDSNKGQLKFIFTEKNQSKNKQLQSSSKSQQNLIELMLVILAGSFLLELLLESVLSSFVSFFVIWLKCFICNSFYGNCALKSPILAGRHLIIQKTNKLNCHFAFFVLTGFKKKYYSESTNQNESKVKHLTSCRN